MNSEIAMSTESENIKTGSFSDIKDLIREVTKEANNSKTPIFIAILAGFLALVSMAEGDMRRQAMIAHIEASNQFSYFQAKNIRKTDSEIATEILEGLGKTELAEKWQTKAERYDKEKKEILAIAKAEQKKREHSLKQGSYFDMAIAVLQIAIVLASVSLLVGGGYLLTGSYILTVIAVFFVINGYGLFLEFPTDPAAIIKAII